MNMGRMYKRVLDVVRSSRFITYLVFRIRVKNKIIRFNWDVTTFVMKKAIDEYVPDARKQVLDMGCGHVGLLTQYIKRNKPTNIVIGADIYPNFVENAKEIARRNNLQVTFENSDLYESLAGRFDFVTFNPPYVPARNVPMAYPMTAFSGNDGTDTIHRFLEQSKYHLANGGKILLGVNCFHVPAEKMRTVIQTHGFLVAEVVQRRFNTARVFILVLQESQAL
jgi:methylase of polypeptide subunit release factors